jgi:hypothetical protein
MAAPQADVYHVPPCNAFISYCCELAGHRYGSVTASRAKSRPPQITLGGRSQDYFR